MGVTSDHWHIIADDIIVIVVAAVSLGYALVPKHRTKYGSSVSLCWRYTCYCKAASHEIAHDLPREFVKRDIMGETLLLAGDQHRAWAASQPLTKFTGHAWSYTTQLWWWLSGRVYSHLLISILRLSKLWDTISDTADSVAKTQREQWVTKREIWVFSLLQNRGEEPNLCWGSNRSSKAFWQATYKHTSKHISLRRKKKKRKPTLKQLPSHLPKWENCHSKLQNKEGVRSKTANLKTQKTCTNKKTEERPMQW